VFAGGHPWLREAKRRTQDGPREKRTDCSRCRGERAARALLRRCRWAPCGPALGSPGDRTRVTRSFVPWRPTSTRSRRERREAGDLFARGPATKRKTSVQGIGNRSRRQVAGRPKDCKSATRTGPQRCWQRAMRLSPRAGTLSVRQPEPKGTCHYFGKGAVEADGRCMLSHALISPGQRDRTGRPRRGPFQRERFQEFATPDPCERQNWTFLARGSPVQTMSVDLQRPADVPRHAVVTGWL